MSKCLPIMDQMPPEILEKIFGYTETLEKFRLRQCCKYFKQIVDDSEIVLQQLTFDWDYSENRANVLVEITDCHHINKTFNDENPGKPVENAMAALKFMEKVLKCHPKIRVVNLELEVVFKTQKLQNSEHRTIVIEELSRVFSELEYKLPVKTLTMRSRKDEQFLMSVLPHLVPGTLRNLFLDNIPGLRQTIDLWRTVETEQWKQAKMLITNEFLTIDLEKTDHFEYMECTVDRLEVEDIKRIVEKCFRDNGWIGRSIFSWQYDFYAIKQYVLQLDHIEEDTIFDEDLHMTIRRDGYECKVEFHKFLRDFKFKRIEDSVS